MHMLSLISTEIGYAWKNSFIPCTKTVYNLIDTGALSVINMDLALKVKRSTKKKRPRENKRIMGPSIETRCPSIETREEFGHWEIDTVIGKKSNDEALLTLIERKTRKELIIRLDGKDAESVEFGLNKLLGPYEGRVAQVFKTITADNGSEFNTLAEYGKKDGVSVYFSHPYSSFERGTNERHNGLIRRVIKTGQTHYSINILPFLLVYFHGNRTRKKVASATFINHMHCLLKRLADYIIT